MGTTGYGNTVDPQYIQERCTINNKAIPETFEKQVQLMRRQISCYTRLSWTEGTASRVFMDLVRTQRGELLHQLEDEGAELQNRIRCRRPIIALSPQRSLTGTSATKRDATSGDTNSFVYDLMLPTYRSCAIDASTGVAKRSRDKIQGRLHK